MKMKTKEELLILLKKRFPDCWFKEGQEFAPDYHTAIWSGSDSEIKGKPLLDAYSSSPVYILEVHRDMNRFLERHGWYAELYDVGTVFFFPNSVTK